MLKSKLMKSLVVTGLICATSVPVFAAEQPEAPQPTMRERVEQILHEDDNNVRRPIPRPARRGPQLTEEQRQAREAARMAWMEMTPQQKFEQRQQMREDFLAQLPAEKRAAIEQRAAEAKAKWDSMTEEQKQDAMRDMFRSFRHRDGFKLHHGYGPGHGRGWHCDGPRDRDRHYDRYHHDGHCDWGDRCPYYEDDKN